MKLTKGQKTILIYIPAITIISFFAYGLTSSSNLDKISDLFLNITTLGIMSIPLSIFFYICYVIYKKIHRTLPTYQKENIINFKESLKITNDSNSNLDSSQQQNTVSKKISKEKLILNIFTVINILMLLPSLMMSGLSGLALGGNSHIPLIFKISNYIVLFFPLIIIISIIISRVSFVSRIKNKSKDFKFPLYIITAPVAIVLSYLFIIYFISFIINVYSGHLIPSVK